MDPREWMARVGSMEQAACIRRVTYREGAAGGLDAWLVKNGAMAFQVLAGKCLDIGEFSYRGTGFHFMAKPGLMGRGQSDGLARDAQRSIMGGLLFTSGLDNICAPCALNGRDYPMHGRLRTTPAAHCCADAFWQNGAYTLRVSGEMREAELFGENLVLRRSITTRLGEKTLTLCDEVENQSFRPEPVLLLYHFNIGWPLLAPGARVVLPSRSAVPRDEASAPGTARWPEVEPPTPGLPEAVYLHEMEADGEGITFAAVVNEQAGLGLMLEYDTRRLPWFMQWKSMASGDYVMGLEPANASVYGRPCHQREGTLHTLAPFEKERFEIKLTVLDGAREIARVLGRAGGR